MNGPRLGLISDLHADLPSLELAWSHLELMGVDEVVCAGDLVDYGPDPDPVVAFVRDREIPTARGNHDRWAAERPPTVPDEFGGESPGTEALAFLRSMEPAVVLQVGRRVVVILHASPEGDLDFVLPHTHPAEVLDGYLKSTGADVIVCGHSHRPMWHRSAAGLVVNPGAVVSPRITSSSRTFGVIDLDDLSARFFEVLSGREIDVEPWPSTPATGGRSSFPGE